MKMSEEQLRQIIEEEINQAMDEGVLDRLRARVAGAKGTGSAIKARAKGLAQYAAGGDPKQVAVGGTYRKGKIVKLAGLYKQKLEKMIRSFLKDVGKLGLDDQALDAMQGDMEKLVKSFTASIADAESASPEEFVTEDK